MSYSIVVDTHTIIWYLTDSSQLSNTASTALDKADSANCLIFLSIISLVEICYLVEKGKVSSKVFDVIKSTLDDSASSLVIAPLSRHTVDVLPQIPRTMVPDMPDRIIAATALALELPLITQDNLIRKLSNVITIW